MIDPLRHEQRVAGGIRDVADLHRFDDPLLGFAMNDHDFCSCPIPPRVGKTSAPLPVPRNGWTEQTIRVFIRHFEVWLPYPIA